MNYTNQLRLSLDLKLAFLHRNPYAIRKILDFKDSLFSLLDNVKSISKKSTPKRTSLYSKIADVSDQSSLVLYAHMEAFEIYLNSAKLQRIRQSKLCFFFVPNKSLLVENS